MKFYVYTEFEGTTPNLTLEDAITELNRESVYNNIKHPYKAIGVQENDKYNNDFLKILEGKIIVTKNIDMSIINKIRREVA